jgi:hypothetical protein
MLAGISPTHLPLPLPAADWSYVWIEDVSSLTDPRNLAPAVGRAVGPALGGAVGLGGQEASGE